MYQAKSFFIEKLLEIIIENENNLCINKISRKKNKTLTFTKESDVLIDDYISSCQNYNFCEEDLLKNFKKLINKCFDLEKINTKKEISKKCDIDLLFKNKIDNINYFLELKYNDDHDTDKFININRKLIKTYIGICNYLEIYDLNKFKLILYYMTPKRMKGNIYIPESFNIYRGNRLFKEFFSVKYEELDELMKNISDDPKIISTFDKMYKKIRYDIKL